MNTRRLFREDVYLKTCEAVVQTVSTHEGKVLVTLDQTIFFPTGGGQSCDIGTMNGLPVVDVYEYKDDILHWRRLRAGHTAERRHRPSCHRLDPSL